MFLISFVIFIILTVQGLWIVEKGIRPTLITIAKNETQKIGTYAINDALNKHIVEGIDVNELVHIDTDAEGYITGVVYNPTIYTRVLAQATNRVQRFLKMVEEGRLEELTGIPDNVEIDFNENMAHQDGIVYSIPLGQATDNALLAHLGPLVPVKFTMIGDVMPDISLDVQPTGINNTTITLYLDIAVDVQVVIPFATDAEVVSTSVPIGIVFVSGRVPEYYNVGGEGFTPAIINQSDLIEAVEQDRGQEQEE